MVGFYERQIKVVVSIPKWPFFLSTLEGFVFVLDGDENLVSIPKWPFFLSTPAKFAEAGVMLKFQFLNGLLPFNPSRSLSGKRTMPMSFNS